MFARVGAGFDDYQAEIRKGANVHEADVRMAADIAPVLEKFASILVRESATAIRVQSGARYHFIANLAVGGNMLVGNGPRPDYPHAHQFILRWLI